MRTHHPPLGGWICDVAACGLDVRVKLSNGLTTVLAAAGVPLFLGLQIASPENGAFMPGYAAIRLEGAVKTYIAIAHPASQSGRNGPVTHLH